VTSQGSTAAAKASTSVTQAATTGENGVTTADLANRPFEIADVEMMPDKVNGRDYFLSAPPMVSDSGPELTDAQARDYLQTYMEAEAPGESARQQAALDMYDSQLRPFIASPTLRSVYASLQGSRYQGVLDVILTGRTPEFSPGLTFPLVSSIRWGAVDDPDSNMAEVFVNNGTGQLTVVFNQRDQGILTPGLLVATAIHEIVTHQDAQVTDSEEIAGGAVSARAGLEQLLKHPELARALNSPGSIERVARMNNWFGTRLLEGSPNESTDPTRIGILGSNRGGKLLPNSDAPDKSFAEYYNPQPSDNTPLTPLMKDLCPGFSGDSFDSAFIAHVDRVIDTFTLEEKVRLVQILQLRPTALTPTSSATASSTADSTTAGSTSQPTTSPATSSTTTGSTADSTTAGSTSQPTTSPATTSPTTLTTTATSTAVTPTKPTPTITRNVISLDARNLTATIQIKNTFANKPVGYAFYFKFDEGSPAVLINSAELTVPAAGLPTTTAQVDRVRLRELSAQNKDRTGTLLLVVYNRENQPTWPLPTLTARSVYLAIISAINSSTRDLLGVKIAPIVVQYRSTAAHLIGTRRGFPCLLFPLESGRSSSRGLGGRSEVGSGDRRDRAGRYSWAGATTRRLHTRVPTRRPSLWRSVNPS